MYNLDTSVNEIGDDACYVRVCRADEEHQGHLLSKYEARELGRFLRHVPSLLMQSEYLLSLCKEKGLMDDKEDISLHLQLFQSTLNTIRIESPNLETDYDQ